MRCRCGHYREAHRHYRAGTDCAVCLRSGCRRYRPDLYRWIMERAMGMSKWGETAAAITKAASAGKTVDEISDELGITRTGIWKSLKRAGADSLLTEMFRRHAPTHGTRSTYGNGCRCDLCTDANTRECLRDASHRDPTAQVHGTVSTYVNYQCRCDPCVAAQLEQQRRRRRRNADAATQRGNPWTGADLEYIMQMQPDGRRYLRPATECAVALGRTVSAVDTQRKLCRTDSRKAAMAGLRLRP